MPQLNTGWKTWDKYLAHLVGHPIAIVEVGVYLGDATVWFLQNICTHPRSVVYAIDTFRGSAEYDEDFREVKTKFFENIRKTGRENQVIVMEGLSSDKLVEIDAKVDLVFVDASHEARDVLSDGVLSWKLLKPGGIMIFDDYEWKKLDKPYFCPKLAIDSFIEVFSPELIVLKKAYQVLVQKRLPEDVDRPVISEHEILARKYSKLVNYALIPTITQLPSIHVQDLKWNMITNKDCCYAVSAPKLKIRIRDGPFAERVHRLGKMDIDPTRLLWFDANHHRVENYLRRTLQRKIWFNMVENLSLLPHPPKKELVMMNFNVDPNNTVHNYTVACRILQSRWKFRSLLWLNVPYNQRTLIKEPRISIGKNCFLQRTNVNLSSYKVDICHFTATWAFQKDERRMQEELYLPHLLRLVCLALTIQEKGGSAIFIAFTFCTKASIDVLTLLQKYYQSVRIVRTHIHNQMSLVSSIIADGFKGIEPNELPSFDGQSFVCQLFDNPVDRSWINVLNRFNRRTMVKAMLVSKLYSKIAKLQNLKFIRKEQLRFLYEYLRRYPEIRSSG